jgi:putative glycerol-1-phosphate prenyltransferase
MLIDGGRPSSVSYISNTTPIPHDKNEIALATALAGQMLGLKLIYADAGSGANVAVSDGMIKRLSQTLSVPLVVGGGIKTPEEVYNKILAGANATVVGNVLEKAPSLVIEMSLAAKEASSKLIVNANNV